MATITKTYTETTANPSNAKSTWTISVSASDITASDSTFSLPTAKLTAKYSAYSGKAYGLVSVNGSLRTPSNTALAVIYASHQGQWAGNTNKTINFSYFPNSIIINTTSDLFNSGNPTQKTVGISFVSSDVAGTTASTASMGTTAPSGAFTSISTTNWGTLFNITLNAPPTFDSTQVYFDTPYVYAGYTTASVDVSDISIKYGGNISSVAFTVGNQTVTGSGNGTLSIALTAGGTFTPTVKVTDSRGQVTTKTLDAITVNTYVAPTTSFTVERTNSLGVPNDEGESAVITATFNYTDDMASLTTPTVVVTDQDNIIVTPTITWYINRELTTVISNWSSVSSGVTVYALLDNANHNLFNTQKSYQIALTPNDIRSSGTTITQILGGAFYTVDFLAGGHGIAFGQPCHNEGFYCNMNANFKKNINILEDIEMYLDCNGSSSSSATSGEDMDLFNNIYTLGWYNDVIV